MNNNKILFKFLISCFVLTLSSGVQATTCCDEDFTDDFDKSKVELRFKAIKEEIEAPVKKGEKVGRNEPCPCGSGKKYKKCCGMNGEE